MDPGRRAHYAGLYDPTDSGPAVVVWGNCQAEALRVLLEPSRSLPGPTVRVPPVHELTGADLAPLRHLLRRTTLLVSQPVRAGYRSLPVGTADIAAVLPAGARVLRWPVLRFAGLHPFQALIRHPDDPALPPPVVPYHDLRTLARAAGRDVRVRPNRSALRQVAVQSRAELRRREGGLDVSASDLLAEPSAGLVHTLNHPGNELLVQLARRVQAAIGVPVDAADPGRTLLGAIRAPVEPDVADALGLPPSEQTDWLVEGSRVTDEEIRAAQLQWYGCHPGWVEAGLARHRDRMELLGLQ